MNYQIEAAAGCFTTFLYLLYISFLILLEAKTNENSDEEKYMDVLLFIVFISRLLEYEF